MDYRKDDKKSQRIIINMEEELSQVTKYRAKA